MSEITFDTLEKLDDLADGIFTDPWPQEMDKYNFREMAEKARELGRPLTEDEADEYLIA